jgi:hypothetical protein
VVSTDISDVRHPAAGHGTSKSIWLSAASSVVQLIVTDVAVRLVKEIADIIGGVVSAAVVNV